ncbi:unnamed protein product [Cylicocyclus nassatus]|uniref:Uncharacterized protein n=1 Tax=Cylicocyclus nassatus TaxID=53992 RepID=A0AA36GWG9_CYLNA|nr:unnamed protein product [Cylicocyclus nassatus]
MISVKSELKVPLTEEETSNSSYHALQLLDEQGSENQKDMLRNGRVVPLVEDEDLPCGSACDDVCKQGTAMDRMEGKSSGTRSLYDCIHNGRLDLNEAARFILKGKRNGTFSQAMYDEFVSEAATKVHHYANNGMLDLHDPFLEMRLNSIGTFMMSQIQCAKLDRLIRVFEAREKSNTMKSPTPTMSLKNLSKIWRLEGPPPFITAELPKMLANYKFKESDNAFQNFASLFRYILQRITSPPVRIQEYAVRLNGRHGKRECLMSLPVEIENLLLDFAEDLSGLGHNELKGGVVVNPAHSSFFMSLGETYEERRCKLEQLTQQRIELRSEIFKGLQLALRDVRSYSYDEDRKQWISNKKTKRARVENDEEWSQEVL